MNNQRLADRQMFEANALEDIDPVIYYAERMLQSFRENYFGTSEDYFDKDEDAKTKFVYSYQEMDAQLFAISELLFNARLKIDFAQGIESDIVKAHIRNEAEMQRGLMQKLERDGAKE